MANQITLVGNPVATTVPGTNAAPIVECDPGTHQVEVNDILAAINLNNTNITNLNTDVNNHARIKTRVNGNILYMTDDGTTP